MPWPLLGTSSSGVNYNSLRQNRIVNRNILISPWNKLRFSREVLFFAAVVFLFKAFARVANIFQPLYKGSRPFVNVFLRATLLCPTAGLTKFII